MSSTERADTDIQQDVMQSIGGAGIPLTVSVEQGVVTLEGVVLSEEEREAAVDLVNFVPGVADIVDSLEVMDMENDQPNVLLGMPTRPDEWDPQREDFGDTSISPDEVETYDAGRVEGDWTTDERVAIQDGAAYFPPTDPPTDISDDPDGIEVASGFQSTSLDEEGAMEPDEDLQGHDDVRDSEIVDNVVRELNEDAATTALNIHVASVRGTVYLTGYVNHPSDADQAAAVAERVSGVRQVVERLVIGDQPVAVQRPPIHRSVRTRSGRVAVPSAAWRATVARNERWLEAERAKVSAQIKERKEELASFGRDQSDEGTVSNHQGDVASDVASADVLNSEIVSLEDEIDAIDEARRMMDDGRYGICSNCGRLIDPARLRAFPLAMRCIDCQRRFDEESDASLQAGQRRGIG